MKRAYFTYIFCVALLLFLIGGISTISVAEVKTLKIEISDYVSNADAIKIRRLLAPWADAKDITFHTPVDKNGRKRHFTTVVEIIPRRGISKYSNTHTFDVYDITRQLKDSRYRGRHGLGQVRLLKTEATVQGTMFAYPGFTRGSIRDIPIWARWRPHTSEIHHAIKTGSDDQKFVFSASPEFDQMRNDVVNNNNDEVEIQGEIVGFDGVYPILNVRSYKVGPRALRRNPPPQKEPVEGENPAEKQKRRYDYLENDR
jgi:hypothetical protein